MKVHAPSSKHVHFNPLLYKDIVGVMAWLAQPSTPNKESLVMDYQDFQENLESIVLHSKTNDNHRHYLPPLPPPLPV